MFSRTDRKILSTQNSVSSENMLQELKGTFCNGRFVLYHDCGTFVKTRYIPKMGQFYFM